MTADRIEVTRGGDIDAEVVAALTVALTPPPGGPPDAHRRGSPWAHAARLEGIGACIVAAPGDLREPGAPG